MKTWPHERYGPMRPGRSPGARAVILSGVLGLLACGGGGPPPPSTAGLHQDCTSLACAQGQSCLTYHGFAGQELRTCEIRCPAGQADCPSGLTCATVSDGPTEDVCM